VTASKKAVFSFCFNPRTREGCDSRGYSSTGNTRSFNPRTREGCDLSKRTLRMVAEQSFNPRTREGCDSTSWHRFTPLLSFNPRTREGCDKDPNDVATEPHVSIHAPARGATLN